MSRSVLIPARSHGGWKVACRLAAAVGLVVLCASAPGASHRGRTWDLVYLFDAGNLQHLARAVALHRETAGLESTVRCVGVVADARAVSTARGAGVELGLMTASEAWDAGLGPRRPLGVGGDRIYLLSASGAEVASGAGPDMERVLASLRAATSAAGPDVATDINFSTWGKVKDLFR